VVTAAVPVGVPHAEPVRPVVTWMGAERNGADQVLSTGVFTLLPTADGSYEVYGTISDGRRSLGVVPAGPGRIAVRQLIPPDAEIDVHDEPPPGGEPVPPDGHGGTAITPTTATGPAAPVDADPRLAG
jgi:hypothetical protein